MKITLTRLALGLFFVLAGASAWAQKQTPLDIALRHLEQQRESWQLTAADIADVVVSDQYVSKHNGATHIYFIQRHAGIELYNAVNGVHIASDGQVVFATNRFTPRLAELVNTTVPTLTAIEAIEAAATYLELVMEGRPQQIDKIGDRQFTFKGGAISNSDIKVKLVYQLTSSGAARLAWDLAIDMPATADYWSMRIDAENGQVLHQQNWTVYCNFSSETSHHHGENCGIGQRLQKLALPVREALASQNSMLLNDNAQYRVFPAPFESPLDGDREMVGNPADTVASPFGWHDTNGQEGADYTITRGNNVHAFLDTEADDTPNGDEPDGGADLIFDFPMDLSQEPSTFQEAAVTQLFYFNNYIHDFTYHYGFDEASGNFQQNNYGNGGNGGDYVLAQAQDGSGTNNANFGTPGDGGNGRMQMFLWSGGGRVFTVNSPQPVAGAYEVQTAGFGATITEVPVTADVVVVDDGTTESNFGCNALVNGEEMAGKIALIDRGLCEFGLKALNAQNAGAVGAIICNFEEELVNMGGGAVGNQVTIPVISMGVSDCQIIRQFAGQGLNVTFQQPEDNGPDFLDADLDNGIIAHEYGHGISNRLTGGPSLAGCLGNDEQMGEGWSDFFALITTVKPGDTGEMPRGVGAYVLRQEANGLGIRRQRYSTDMSVNTQTLDDILGTTAPHPLGEVWTITLWDLYWAMVEEYGFDEDQINGTGGNNMAIQLVMDGMKLQSCSPGFMDGRDAILAADQLNFDGANECLIWSVFARRGAGYFAEQGSSDDRNDNVENFDPRPECIKELKIAKAVTPLVEAGDELTVTITVINHKGFTVEGVVVDDEIPLGTVLVNGSASLIPSNVTADKVAFELGAMADGEEQTITYRLATDPGQPSTTRFFDGMEDGLGLNWFPLNLDPEGFNIWEVTDTDPFEGDYSWYVPNTEFENDQIFQLLNPITIGGEQPVLRFIHKWETQSGTDGGFVEVSNDNGASWKRPNEEFIRNGYPSGINYSTFAIPNLRVFAGESDWIDSYLDLSEYVGQDILLRFRFGSDAGGFPGSANPGWYVDNIEIMDMVNYNGEACVTSDEGGLACAIAEERGTIIEPGLSTSTEEEGLAVAGVDVFPNPARDVINVGLNLSELQEVTVSLVGIDGRVLQQQRLDTRGGYQVTSLDVAELPAGLYFVKVYAGAEIAVEKVVIR